MKNCVRKLRRELDITQQKLADDLGVSRATIIGIEKEGQVPAGDLVIKIASYFNKDARDIFFIDSVNFVQRKPGEQSASSA